MRRFWFAIVSITVQPPFAPNCWRQATSTVVEEIARGHQGGPMRLRGAEPTRKLLLGVVWLVVKRISRALKRPAKLNESLINQAHEPGLSRF